MTRGFNPKTLKWNESIQISLGKRRDKDLEAETARRIQESLKSKKRT